MNKLTALSIVLFSAFAWASEPFQLEIGDVKASMPGLMDAPVEAKVSEDGQSIEFNFELLEMRYPTPNANLYPGGIVPGESYFYKSNRSRFEVPVKLEGGYCYEVSGLEILGTQNSPKTTAPVLIHELFFGGKNQKIREEGSPAEISKGPFKYAYDFSDHRICVEEDTKVTLRQNTVLITKTGRKRKRPVSISLVNENAPGVVVHFEREAIVPIASS